MNVHIRVLAIGALAKAAGVSAPTIRYYEDIGLLPRPGRSEAGQRIYADADLERLTFIRRCRDFGFSIDQVRVMTGLSISEDQDCTGVRNIAKARLDDLRTKLADMKALQISLERFVRICDAACAGGAGRDCVIFKDIANPSASSSCC